jgi:hypothetical protein
MTMREIPLIDEFVFGLFAKLSEVSVRLHSLVANVHCTRPNQSTIAWLVHAGSSCGRSCPANGC